MTESTYDGLEADVPVQKPINFRLGALWLGLTAVAGSIAVGTSATAADPVVLLPDLAQEPPRDLVIKRQTVKRRVRGRTVRRSVVTLAFTSQVDNVGSGPLLIDGSRASTDEKSMTASQRIMSSDGTSTTVPSVGTWKYHGDSDHQHWHYQRFDVFTLFQKSGKRAAKSGKQGFCIGDRGKGFTFNMNGQPAAQYVSHCDLNKPRALTTFGGMTPGWGDDYAAFLEGQSIDVTRVPSGNYCLEHRATSSFTEAARENNVATAIVKLNTRARRPVVKVLGTSSIADGIPDPSCARGFANAGL